MGTSGGVAFPNAVNPGAIHVIQTSGQLLVFIYIGGIPTEITSWFLLGGHTDEDPSGGFGVGQIGSTWFDTSTNQQKTFTNGGVIGTTVQSSSINGMYRDLRDFNGPTIDSGCQFASWATWTYHTEQVCGNCAQQQADSVAGNAFNGASAATASYEALIAETYTVWAYVKGQSTRSIRFSNDGNNINAELVFPNSAVEPASYEWRNLGSMLINPSVPMQISIPANGNNTLVTIWLRGLYLTKAGDVPSFVPSGKGGDRVFT